MTSGPLYACPACARHIRIREAKCPFCGRDVPAWFSTQTRSRAPTVRMTRAALTAFGLGTVTLTAACGGEVHHSPTDGGGGSDSSLSMDTSSPTDSGGFADTGNFAVPYGVPADVATIPPADSGAPVDATSDASDAGVADSTVVDVGNAPPYGLPPPQDL